MQVSLYLRERVNQNERVTYPVEIFVMVAVVVVGSVVASSAQTGRALKKI